MIHLKTSAKYYGLKTFNYDIEGIDTYIRNMKYIQKDRKKKDITERKNSDTFLLF